MIIKSKLLPLKQMIGFVLQAAMPASITNLIFTLLQGVFPLLLLYAMKLIFDTVEKSINIQINTNIINELITYLTIATGIYFANAVARSIAVYARGYQALYTSDLIFDKLHQKALELDLTYFENSAYHDQLHKARQEAGYRPAQFINSFSHLMQNSLSLLLIAFLMVSFHWLMFFVLFAAILPDIILKIRTSSRIYNLSNQQTTNERKAAYFSHIITSMRYAKEVRLFNLGAYFLDKYKNIRSNIRGDKTQIAKNQVKYEILAQFFAAMVIYLSYGIMAYSAINHTITIGDLVMFVMAFQRGTGYLKELLNSVAVLYEANLFLTNLFDFLNLKTKISLHNATANLPNTIESGISIENVSFSYSGDGKNVINNISLFIPPCSTVALVGDNGAGKTTFVKLLCRLYDVDSGHITIDGNDIRNFDLASLRSNISVVFQDYAPFNMTAQENIGLGKIDSIGDQSAIHQAASYAGIHNLISSLPNGYDSVLGKFFEQGIELSVGEWQKIALARAFFRHAQITILDEPTASMDAQSEYRFYNDIKQLTHGRITILISHRLSSIRMADKIIVLDNGSIIEQGTHEQLIAAGNKYAGMYAMQAANYK